MSIFCCRARHAHTRQTRVQGDPYGRQLPFADTRKISYTHALFLEWLTNKTEMTESDRLSLVKLNKSMSTKDCSCPEGSPRMQTLPDWQKAKEQRVVIPFSHSNHFIINYIALLLQTLQGRVATSAKYSESLERLRISVRQTRPPANPIVVSGAARAGFSKNNRQARRHGHADTSHTGNDRRIDRHGHLIPTRGCVLPSLSLTPPSYRVDGHLANNHSIGTGNAGTKALNRVYVHEVTVHPVLLQET